MPVEETEPTARPGPRRHPGEPVGPEEVTAAVLAVAGDLFGRHGVDAVSLRDIAAAANVNPSLIGRYIGNRAALIDAVYLYLTAQLVADIERGPLRAHSFERNSVVGRWTVVVVHYAVTGQLPPPTQENPVTGLTRAIETHYGIDARSARWRAAQIVGSAVGWRLIEAQLVAMGDLDPTELPAMRADLNLLHNIAGSIGLPTPDLRREDLR